MSPGGTRGVVAAGHPVTAEAGAWALREGGNAIDAALAALMASLTAESPLTGLGAGGFMLVHRPGERDELLDFFVAAPGLGSVERASELDPVPVYFTETTPQVFNVGAASCGVPGTPAGLVAAASRYGSIPLAELARPAIGHARDGVTLNDQQAYIVRILEPILTRSEEGRRLYAPAGRTLRRGEAFRVPDLASDLERLGAEGAGAFYGGEIGDSIADWVCERGGTLSREDLAAYEPVVREPVGAHAWGRSVITNPPPSSGGILIAYVLDVLDDVGSADPASLVRTMELAQSLRTREFERDLYADGAERGMARRLLDEGAIAEAAATVARGRPAGSEPSARGGSGSTTHITAIDGRGACAAVTCSNGTGSGLFVPGTGIHVNNMLGEEDLNPLGFHRTPAGRRMPSMMAPTAILRDGELEAGLGSGGSNRIRSAIVQTTLRLLAGDGVRDAVESPRLHFEQGAVQAEPGIDDAALERLASDGYEIVRWGERNLFFGGVHAVARDPQAGQLVGAGDPRRGGAVAAA